MMTSQARRSTLRGLVLTVALAILGCQREEPQPQEARRDEKLVVFAAASLREAFTSIGDAFKKTHPGVELSFNFAGSQELRTQIDHGAPADVFASADLRHMDELRTQKRVASPVVFARNEPVVVVSKEQAPTLQAFADLPSAKRIVVGGPEVPIGRYTLKILDNASKSFGSDFRARVEAHVVSRELNVRQVLAKVTLGEADAGIVYRTDAANTGDRVTIIAIPAELNVIAEYPIAVVEGAAHTELAQAWLGLVVSPDGQGALGRAGFIVPARVATTPP
ncbi:MAG TPA: molybdate ABC transporter substrate-binding protein [Polyangiaceae bacterium]|nr:molybdate ABC transporter substrate-binding protein [Polyangiaceae bacterium]